MKKILSIFLVLLLFITPLTTSALIINVPQQKKTTKAPVRTQKPVQKPTQNVIQTQINHTTVIFTEANTEVVSEQHSVAVTQESVQDNTEESTNVVPEETYEEYDVEESQVYTQPPVSSDISNVQLTVNLSGNTEELGEYLTVSFKNRNSGEEFTLIYKDGTKTSIIMLPLGEYDIKINSEAKKDFNYDKKRIELTSSVNSVLNINISNITDADNLLLSIFKNNIFSFIAIFVILIAFIIYKKKQGV